jgi:hypothetical protein
MGRTGEFETDCYANLAVCYLLHQLRGRPPVQPPTDDQLERNLSGRHISQEAALAYVRTPDLFVSFAWRMLQGPFPMALFIPRGMDDAAEWGPNNLVGRVQVAGVDPKKALAQHTESLLAEGFKTTGKIAYLKTDGSPAFTHEITFLVEPQQRTATVESRFIADADITVQSIEGLRLHVANDFFNGGKRLWTSDTQTRQIVFDLGKPPPPKETITSLPLGSKWVNLDGGLGIVNLLPDGAPFVLRQSDRRNSPFASLHYDVLASPVQELQPRRFRKGENILHTMFLLVAGDPKRTAALAASAGKTTNH